MVLAGWHPGGFPHLEVPVVPRSPLTWHCGTQGTGHVGSLECPISILMSLILLVPHSLWMWW